MEKIDFFPRPFRRVNVYSKSYKLFQAARDGDLATLSSLLEGKNKTEIFPLLNRPVEEYDQSTTPLLIAAACDHYNVVEVLLSKYGVDVEQSGVVNLSGIVLRNVTALCCAASNGNIEMVKLLIRRYHADVNHTAEYNQTPVREACNGGYLDVVEYLIRHRADIHLRHTFNNSTCLISATSRNFPNVAKFLLSKGADPNIQDNKGMTALHYATKNDSTSLVTELLDAGASYKVQDNRGFTPIEVACEECNDSIVDMFIRNCNMPEEENIRIWELLGAALIFRNSFIMGYHWIRQGMQHRHSDEEQIIAKTGLINITSDPVVYGQRPESRTEEHLREISRYDEDDLTKEALLIMERTLGENRVLCPDQVINRMMMEGSTFQENKQYFKCISLYTKALNIKHNTNKSISYHIDKFVTLFAEMQQVEHMLDPNLVVTIFEQCLTDLEQEWLKVQYIEYEPAVHHARYNVTTNVNSALKMIAILKCVIDTGDGYPEETIINRFVSRLVSLDVKIGKRLEHSLLHVASTGCISRIPALKSPNFDVFKLLLSKGADINALDNEGNTPLHILASYNGEEDSTVFDIICLLLERGVHIDGRNKEFARPLDLANPVVVDRLKEATRKVPLKCLAAQTIQVYYNDQYKKLLPKALVKFVDMH